MSRARGRRGGARLLARLPARLSAVLPATLPAMLRTALRALLHPRRFTREIDEEIAFHIESRTQDLMREGLTRAEAGRRARVEFGAQPAHADRMRRAFGVEWVASVAADLSYAWRLLRRSPGFTAITVVSLALAIGANSAIFSTANELLFARLDVPHAGELRALEWRLHGKSPLHAEWGDLLNTSGAQQRLDVFPYPAVRQLAAAGPELFAYKSGFRATASAGGTARQVTTELVSGNYFTQLDVTPALGRLIGQADDRIQSGAPLVAMLSYAYWERAFGASPKALGTTVNMNGVPATIIGIGPRGFTGAGSVQFAPDFFLPLTAVSIIQPTMGSKDALRSGDLAWVNLMLRLQDSKSEAQTQARLSVELRAAVRATITLSKGDALPTVVLHDGSRGNDMVGSYYAKPMYVLLTLAALVLLLACVNVANLMLARSTVRKRELSIRMALGSGRRRLFRQLLVECLLLCSIGGALGLLLAFAARNLIPSLLLSGWNSESDLHIPFSWRVFAFTGGITMLAALISGLAPALRASHAQPGAALKEVGTASTRRRLWGGKALVGVQVALSTLLVAGSVLFLRTMTNLANVNPGFDSHHLLLFSIDLPQNRYPVPNDIATHRRILSAVRAVPGVASASLSDLPLLSGSMFGMDITLEHPSKNLPPVTDRQADLADVSLHFLSTMHIPLIAGRNFASSDLESPKKVAVVNQAFARHFFGRYNIVGQRFSSDGNAPFTEIIGVAANARYNSLRDPAPPVFFNLYTQQKAMEQTTYLIRSPLPPETLIPMLRRAVARIDHNLPLADIHTQDEQIHELTSQERLFAALTTGFGILALALACAGVYGVFSYAVAGRTREIGIRLALGAERGRVRAAILREALTLSVAALAVGLGATLALTRLVHSLLYGVSAADPLSLAATAGLLLAVALLAAWLPAARASRVDPMQALRHE